MLGNIGKGRKQIHFGVGINSIKGITKGITKGRSYISMRKVYGKNYMVVLFSDENKKYVVYNTRKPWKDGHTHINSKKQADYLVDCELKKKVPQKVNKYFLISLTRITKDVRYRDRILATIDNLGNKNRYKNKPKGFKW